MSTTVTSLVNLNPQLVSNNRDTITEMIQESFPTVDLKRGVVHDLVLYLSALLATANQVTINNNIQSNSLQEIITNPSLADQTQINRILSNYQLTPTTPANASGTVTITVGALIPTTIAKGAVFTSSGGLQFVASDVFNGRITSGTVINANDRLMTQVSNGYAFTINVNAFSSGSAYNLPANTSLTPLTPPANFITSYAAMDFTGGTDAQTTEQLINLLQSGAAIKAWSNRITNKSLIINQPEFVNIIDVSEIGYGDAEQLRYHSIFPVAFGGRIDLYARTQQLPQVSQATKTATLISKVGSLGTWQFTVSATDAPGFYNVVKILQTTDPVSRSGYQPISDTRSFDTTATPGYVPDITKVLEATYSPYSTSIIQFKDTDTDATSLTVNTSTRDYVVYIRAMPLLLDLQEFVVGRDVRPPSSDILVKAPVPCDMSVSITINTRSGDPTPNTANLATAVSNVVNTTGFPGSMPSSTLIKALHDEFDGTLTTVGSIYMTGIIRRPDGTTTVLSNAQLLTIPIDTANLMSSNTVSFILDPNNIAITVVAV